ncbi:MAG: YdbH domain-containing protein [Parvularculaceae bacterium]|nr:YdbH domain-containing protein [Parvularculaceae bacterium]
MGKIARLIVGAGLVLVLTGLGLYFLRAPIAAAAVNQIMIRQGLANPDAKVADVSLTRLTLSSVRAGADPSAPDLTLENVAFDFDASALIFRGRLKSISVGGGRIVAVFDEQRAMSIAGWKRKPKAKTAPPPFSRLSVNALEVIARTPEGDASIDLDGAFDLKDGGAFKLSFGAARAGFAAVSVADARGELALDLSREGAAEISGGVRGAAATNLGVVSADTDISGRLESWRGFFGESAGGPAGFVDFTVHSSSIETDSAPHLAPIASQAAGVGRILAEGALRAEFDARGASLSVAGDTLAIRTDRGDVIKIKGNAAPLYEYAGGVRRISFSGEFDMRAARGESAFSAISEDGGPWRLDGTADLSEFSLAGVFLDGLAGRFGGEIRDGRFDGAANVSTRLKGATIGRLHVNDAPAAGAFSVSLSPGERTLLAAPAEGACIAIDRASIRMDGIDMETSLGAASLCPSSAPLVSINWGEGGLTRIIGGLDAKTVNFRLGRTTLNGAPPDLKFTLDYRPAEQTTHIKGELSGGRAILNGALTLSGASGEFTTDIVGESLGADAALSIMKVAQNVEVETIAPVNVSGAARLAENVVTFNFDAETPSGAPLGKGKGSHQMETGAGEAVFDSGVLTFARALQPDRIIPALRGVISGATGAADGTARFSWRPNALETSASINLENVSFTGPGVAVTRTEGVTGSLDFSSMSPPTTNGDQTLTIAKIDLDALKLENGAVRFRAPGDNTIEIIEAEFPWFGGAIGVYDSKVAIEGRSAATLQINDVDLGGLLDYINIEGLSGEGRIEGVLPLSVEGGKARVNEGVVSSKGSGVIRYKGNAANAASQSNEQSALAFEILRELRFEKLSATIDGPLDGAIDFNILFEGHSLIPVKTGGKTQRIDSPVKYRITINAPILSLIDQAILSSDVKLQIERARQSAEEAKRVDN